MTQWDAVIRVYRNGRLVERWDSGDTTGPVDALYAAHQEAVRWAEDVEESQAVGPADD